MLIIPPPLTPPGISDGPNETQRGAEMKQGQGENFRRTEGARNRTFKGFYLSYSRATSELFTPQQTLERGEDIQTPTRILFSM